MTSSIMDETRWVSVDIAKFEDITYHKEKDGNSTKISNYASGEGARITLQGSSAGGDVLINNDL